jgi:hypothetical protein
MNDLKENFKKTLLSECTNLLKSNEVKNNIKEIFNPIISIILNEIYPYIYLSLIFVALGFLLILVTMVLLMRIYKIINRVNKIIKKNDKP